MNWELLFWLVGAHFVGDIALQSPWMAEMKAKRVYILLAHCFIWTTICCIPLAVFSSVKLWEVSFLSGWHAAIDLWKMRYPNDDAHWWMIYPDQAAHLATLAIVWCL